MWTKKVTKNTRQIAKSHELPRINSLCPIIEKKVNELFIIPDTLC